MNLHQSLLTTTLAAGSLLAAGASLRAAESDSQVDDAWFRAWPPASATYSFLSSVRGVEISGGWTLDRRHIFHERGLEFKSDVAPHVQLGFGLKF